jgi:ABC-type multidrug transport system fused ATPase/permease subunit
MIAFDTFCDIARLFQNYCLGMWMRSMQEDQSAVSTGSTFTAGTVSPALMHYLLSALIVVGVISFKVVWSVQCTTRAAQSIHDRFMHSVMLAPCSWFDATPIGRIINRFSKDISTIVSTVSSFTWVCLLKCLLCRTPR